jgi:hypothetical protein
MATRTWVSGVGDDANPGSRTAPCKTFAGAISKTDNKGEISALDPGGFGAVTITKSVTLNGDATLASILATGINAVIINVPAAETVVLRNLSIVGGINGVRIIAGGNVHVERCTIAGFSGHGIDVSLTAAGHLFVKDTVIRNCGGNGINLVAAAGIVATASIENVHLEQCGNNGLHPGSGSRVNVRNSVLDGNSTGLLVEQTAVDTPIVMVERCRLSANASFGIRAVGAVEVRFSNCVVNRNGNGILATGGAGPLRLVSFGNNVVSGNGTDGTPTSTQLPA